MSTNNTEDTVFNGGLNEQTQSVVKKAAKDRKKVEVKPWQKVVIGGTTGIMLGAGGTYAATLFAKGNTPDEPIQEDAEGMKIAHDVDDSLSFREAFDTARAEVGSGGVFHWHGGVYGTYTADEWNSMTPEQRDEFNGGAVAHVSEASAAQSQAADSHADNHAAIHADADDIDMSEVHDTSDTETAQVETVEQERADVDLSSDVQIVGADDIVKEDGSVITVGAAIVDGREVYVVDVDHDGTFDVASVDVNGNGRLDEDEIIDISSENLQVSTFRSEEEEIPLDDVQQDDLLADNSELSGYSEDIPDYTNDASLV